MPKGLIIILLATTFSINCVQPSNLLPVVSTEQIKSDNAAVDREVARKLSDKVVEDLINQNIDQLRSNAAGGLKEYYSEEQFKQLLGQMNTLFGKPLEADFKNDELGFQIDSSGERKPMRKFWYAVKTTKYEKGSRFLFVQIVPDEERLAFSAFSIVMFPMGIPSQLK